MTTPWIVVIAILCAAVVVLIVVVLGLLRRTAPVLERAEQILLEQSLPQDLGGLAQGSVVPDVELSTSDGQPVTLDQLLREPAVFLFVDRDCVACEQLTRALSDHEGSLSPLRLFLIAGPDASREYGRLEALDVALLVQSDGVASAAFQQRAFPQAFAVDSRRVVVDKTIPAAVGDLERLAELSRHGVPAAHG